MQQENVKYRRIIAPCSSSSETSENDGTEDETSSSDTGPGSTDDQLQGNCDNSDDMLVVMMVIMVAMKVMPMGMLIIIIMVMIMIM